jgi:hypothetical protein
MSNYVKDDEGKDMLKNEWMGDIIGSRKECRNDRENIGAMTPLLSFFCPFLFFMLENVSGFQKSLCPNAFVFSK